MQEGGAMDQSLQTSEGLVDLKGVRHRRGTVHLPQDRDGSAPGV